MLSCTTARCDRTCGLATTGARFRLTTGTLGSLCWLHSTLAFASSTLQTTNAAHTVRQLDTLLHVCSALLYRCRCLHLDNPRVLAILARVFSDAREHVLEDGNVEVAVTVAQTTDLVVAGPPLLTARDELLDSKSTKFVRIPFPAQTQMFEIAQTTTMRLTYFMAATQALQRVNT